VTGTGVFEELDEWLGEHWDPDLTVGEWWDRLGRSGWAAPTLPREAYGRGLAPADGARVLRRIAAAGALGPPSGLGWLLAAPTIAAFGDAAQIERYVADIVTGRAAWCQLFSEPGAGSDLASLSTRAVRDGHEWVVTGQKVWTSAGHLADYGMLIARTDPDAPKHQGITYFAFPMHQPGVEVRPLREMTGRALFNEVFLNEARVPADAVIGPLHGGWKVANATLAFERAGLGAGGTGGGASAIPGTVAGQLGRRAGDVVGSERSTGRPRGRGSAFDTSLAVARARGRAGDAVIRQELARLYTLVEIGRFNTERAKALRSRGGEIAGLGNLSKLAMSDIVRRQRDLGLALLGAQGMLHGYDEAASAAVVAATGNELLPGVTSAALFAQAPPIYGGTDQIQRNLVAERALGLPREPSGESRRP